MSVSFKEDNEATIRIINTGKSPALRHVGRTHRVDLAFLQENKVKGEMDLQYCPTEYMCADVFTKHFLNVAKWEYAITLIGHVNPEKLWSRGDKAQMGRKDDGESSWKEKAVNGPTKMSKKTNTNTALTAEQRITDKSRTLIEFCCSPDSLLGSITKQSKGCNVVRLTQDIDVTSDHGLQLAINSIEGPSTLLWGSIPCTGGCPWQRINKFVQVAKLS
jgi:hypothetical protein